MLSINLQQHVVNLVSAASYLFMISKKVTISNDTNAYLMQLQSNGIISFSMHRDAHTIIFLVFSFCTFHTLLLLAIASTLLLHRIGSIKTLNLERLSSKFRLFYLCALTKLLP